jgi:CRP-like cAMP-binding protein
MLNEFTVSGSFRSIVLQYLKTMIVNISQIAVCNRRHTIDQQLCRTLLNQLDRVAGNSLSLTHEMISRSIGVRREGISEAAKRLETKGIISYVRGNITIIDRESLIKNSCECYSIMNKNSN